jgi:tetratricopeptide (TPR) repeat protein
MRYLLILTLLIVIFSACASNEDPAFEGIRALLTEAKANPTKETLDKYFAKVNEFLSDNKDNKELIKPMLEEASQFAVSQGQHSKAVGYLMPILKNHVDCSLNQTDVLTLAKSMRALNKGHAASIVYANYKSKFSSSPTDESLERLLTDLNVNPTRYIDTLFEKVFREPDQFGLNREAALQFVDVAEAQALSDPCNPKSPDFLYRAGEIARSIRTLPKAMSIYDWLLEEYPDYEKTPTVYFLKGFMLENNVEDKEGAREIYSDFLTKYPNHEMADDVRFLVDNLDKTDEQILELLEQKQKEKADQNQ